MLCAILSGNATAGEALDAINTAVTLQAEKIEQQYGVLLTYAEMDDLKVSLIARKQAAELQSFDTAAIAEKATQANDIYQLTDPMEQRKLLIEMQVVAGGGDDDDAGDNGDGGDAGQDVGKSGVGDDVVLCSASIVCVSLVCVIVIVVVTVVLIVVVNICVIDSEVTVIVGIFIGCDCGGILGMVLVCEIC